jgi:hypothetical protein
MRVQVIYGDSADDITDNTNQWLKANETKIVVISISPAMPRGANGGAYLTITYTEVENFFKPVEESRG